MPLLSDLPVGSAFLLACRITSRDAAGTGLALYTRDRTQQGSLLIAPDQTITGTLASPPSQVNVTVAARPFSVGDVVTSDATGEGFLVRDAWVGPDGFQWSTTPDRKAVYTTAGFSKIGHVTLD